MPLEKESGSTLTDYAGGLELRDLAFSYPGSKDPLFESLDLKLEPGNVLVVTGNNGMGKTTFAKVLLGLLEPIRGQILADGLDIQQAASEWWRKQIIYLPQEPSLLNATIGENLLVNCPETGEEALKHAVDAAGLRRFVDESENGLETPVVDNGWRLSGDPPSHGAGPWADLRRKIGLFDEPIESFDADGIATVHAILSEMAKQGKTSLSCRMIRRLKGQHTVLDINTKPTPKITLILAAGQARVASEPKPRCWRATSDPES